MLSQLEAAGVPVFYIQGNHEYDRHAPWLSVHPWPRHIHQTTTDIAGAQVYGLDWLPKGDVQVGLKAIPAGTDILITHQVWKDFMGTIGRTECELSDVHNVQTVLAGDFHVTKVATGVNANGQPIKMLSPGSTAMQDISESPDKFFFVIGRDAAEFVFVPVELKARTLLRYEVKTTEELDELCAGKLAEDISAAIETATRQCLPDEIKKPLVRIKFNKQLPDAYLRMLTAVGESAHVFCDALADKTKTDSRGVKHLRGTVNTVLTALEELLGVETVEYKLAASLVQATDPGKILDECFREHIGKFNEETNAVTAVECEELGASS